MADANQQDDDTRPDSKSQEPSGGGGYEQKPPSPQQRPPYETQDPGTYGGKGNDPEEPYENPCADRPGGGGTNGPPTSGCSCRGRCECKCEMKLPSGTILRVIEELKKELDVPSVCPDAPKDAKTEFDKALQECAKEYEGIGAIEKSYREYHCQIDCQLDEAETWCKDLEAWCKQVDEKTHDCIANLWKEHYEKEEHWWECCCWLPRRDEFESLQSCLDQSKDHLADAKSDFEAVKSFEKTLKARFDELKKLYDDAKKRADAKEPKAVCAILFEYRKVYHRLGELVLWYTNGTTHTINRRDRCKKPPVVDPTTCGRPKKVKDDLDAPWLRETLIATLRNLLLEKYRQYCWHQQWIDAKHCRDWCEEKLNDFRGTRRDKFILEAQDCYGNSSGSSEQQQQTAG